jgi:hypothetical protein
VAKKKRQTALPRVTLLAYNRRDLVAFVAAVETLRLLVDDLRAEVAQLKAKRTPKPAPFVTPALEGAT